MTTTLSAKCDFSVVEMKISCEAHRTSMQSTLNWSESLTDNESSGEEEGIFEFAINDSTETEILGTLEECIATACKLVEATVNVSK